MSGDENMDMGTGMGIGLGNESDPDPERVRELESGSEGEEGKFWTGRGRFNKGNWYCDCDGNPRAKCLTAGKKAKPENRGRKFFCCPKTDERDACRFWLWVDDEPRAKAWHRKYGPPEDPETPSRKNKDWADNPWTKSASSTKRKAEKVVAFSDEKEEAGGAANEDDEMPESPSRKASKVTRDSMPGNKGSSSLQAAAKSLPSPESERKQMNDPGESSTSRAVDSSGTGKGKGKALASAIDLGDEPENSTSQDLATKVIKLLRSENVELKESTQLQLRHELELVTDRHEAEVGRYKQTISKMSTRLDELEDLLEKVGGVVAMDEDVEFSD